uniref:Uncharacterized protein n=1 Tax=Ceratitis capitata TaxID=7213 RepID=W8BTN6_CERCA
MAQRYDLGTDAQSIPTVWREHCSSMQNGSESVTSADDETNFLIDDDGIGVSLPDYEEVRIEIFRLKNNIAAAADALPAELFKYGLEELIRCMRQILCEYGRMSAD